MKKYLTILLWLVFIVVAVGQTVYVTKTGKKYHKVTCSYLSKSAYSLDLKDAVDQGYTPCSRCNPPTLKQSSTIEKSGSETAKIKSSNNGTSSGTKRCIAITKKGTQCKRNAKPGSDYCWQHSK